MGFLMRGNGFLGYVSALHGLVELGFVLEGLRNGSYAGIAYGGTWTIPWYWWFSSLCEGGVRAQDRMWRILGLPGVVVVGEFALEGVSLFRTCAYLSFLADSSGTRLCRKRPTHAREH